MDDAFVFEVEKGFEDLLYDAGDVGFSESTAYQYFLEERSSFAEFKDQDIVGVVVVDFEEFGDVVVVKRLHDYHLSE